MGKIGDVASLGAVAIAAYIVWQLSKVKLPGLPKIPDPIPGFNWLGFPTGDPGRRRTSSDDAGGSTDISDPIIEYVPVIVRTVTQVTPPPAPILIAPGVEPILEGLISRRPDYYAQVERGFIDAGGGVNV